MRRDTMIRPGRYRVGELRCRCGGELEIERRPASREFRWELYCTACQTCDPNGYRTLALAAEAAEAFAGRRRRH